MLVLPDLLYSHRHWRGSNRLASNFDAVELAVERMYRHIESLASNGAVSAEPREEHGSRKVRPRVLVTLSSTRVWTGRRTGVFLRLLTRSRLDWSLQSLGALLWAIWGAVSPRSLRFCLQTLVRLSDYHVRHRFPDGSPVEWTGGAQPSSQEAPNRCD